MLAIWLFGEFERIGGVLILIFVSLFLAAGLNPVGRVVPAPRAAPQPRGDDGHRPLPAARSRCSSGRSSRSSPTRSPQITDNAPGWLDQLQRNKKVQELDERFDIIDKVRDYVQDGNFTSGLFGGVLGFGLRVLGALANAFVIIVLTLYFLSSLETTKRALYSLAPASRRERVSKLGDQVVESVGGYVAGAFVVALCAGVTSLIFLFIVGLGEYAVALAFVVTVLDVIPMIGATIGAVMVSAIALRDRLEDRRRVRDLLRHLPAARELRPLPARDVASPSTSPVAVTVIAALVGAALLGVVGALLAIPTAAAILLIVREVFIRRQDAR